MSLTPMRPTFEMEIPYSRDEVAKRVGAELKKSSFRSKSMYFDNYLELHIPESDLRYWSPHLSLSFDGDTTHTRVMGRFAPRQEVWTLIWTLYMTLAFAAFFSIVFASAFWMMGQSTWLAIVSLASLSGIGLLYAMSQIGQRWSADQMVALHADWNHLIEHALASDDQKCGQTKHECTKS